MKRVLLVPLAVPLMAAVPRLDPAPPGVIVKEVSAPLTKGGAYTVVASRARRGTAGLFQYYLSIYAAWPGAAWHQVYASKGNADHLIPQVTRGHGTARYFPTQSLELLGVVSPIGVAPVAVAEMRNEAADCGEGTVMLLGRTGARRFGPAVVIANPCGLTAELVRRHVVLSGPYYAKGTPLYAPTIVKARAVLRYHAGRWAETPDYFRLDTGSPKD